MLPLLFFSCHRWLLATGCRGSDPYITDEMWDYAGFPNMSNATWAAYDVHYLNPFDSCCWLKEMDSWVPRIKAIKDNITENYMNKTQMNDMYKEKLSLRRHTSRPTTPGVPCKARSISISERSSTAGSPRGVTRASERWRSLIAHCSPLARRVARRT